MKKNLLIALLCVIVSMSFVSCEDDGWDTGDAPFLGSWYGVNNGASFTFYGNGTGWYTDEYGNTTAFSWDYDRDELDLYLDDAYDSYWAFAWSFTPDGYLSLFDLDYGGTTYYMR